MFDCCYRCFRIQWLLLSWIHEKICLIIIQRGRCQSASIPNWVNLCTWLCLLVITSTAYVLPDQQATDLLVNNLLLQSCFRLWQKFPLMKTHGNSCTKYFYKTRYNDYLLHLQLKRSFREIVFEYIYCVVNELCNLNAFYNAPLSQVYSGKKKSFMLWCNLQFWELDWHNAILFWLQAVPLIQSLAVWKRTSYESWLPKINMLNWL